MAYLNHREAWNNYGNETSVHTQTLVAALLKIKNGFFPEITTRERSKYNAKSIPVQIRFLISAFQRLLVIEHYYITVTKPPHYPHPLIHIPE